MAHQNKDLGESLGALFSKSECVGHLFYKLQKGYFNFSYSYLFKIFFFYLCFQNFFFGKCKC